MVLPEDRAIPSPRAAEAGGPPRRLLVNVAAGAGQALISGIVLFVLYRVLLERLGAEQIGAWSLMMAWFALPRLADLGLPGGMVRFGAVAMAAGDRARVIAVIGWGVLAVCLLTAIGALATALALGAYAPAFLMHQPGSGRLLVWGSLIAWLACITVVIRSGLDALQRVDLRHGTLVLQNVLLLACSCALVRDGNLEGLLLAQLISSGAAVAVTAWALLRELRRNREEGPVRADVIASGGVMRSLLSYGLPFQVTTITGFLIEPLVKLLLSPIGGLAAVAWYEMASRLIGQARSLAVNALEALVPHIASFTAAERQSQIADEYRRSFAFNLAFATLGVALFLASLPFIAWLWIGRDEPLFLGFAALLALAWWVSALAVPAYFIAQGIGVQRWNVWAHTGIAVTNGVFGVLLGAWYGSIGVVSGVVLATVVGNAVLIVGFHRELRKVTGQVVSGAIPWGYVLAVAVAMLPLIHAWHWTPAPVWLLIASLATCVVVGLVVASVDGNFGRFKGVVGRLWRMSTGRQIVGGSQA